MGRNAKLEDYSEKELNEYELHYIHRQHSLLDWKFYLLIVPVVFFPFWLLLCLPYVIIIITTRLELIKIRDEKLRRSGEMIHFSEM